MCKAAPGPRCSNDTLNEWRSSWEKLQELKTLYEKSQQMLEQAETVHQTAPTDDTFERVSEWETYLEDLSNQVKIAEQQNETAQLIYYSTPAGKQSLQNQIQENTEKIVHHRTGMFTDDGDWVDVSYPEYATFTINACLQEAITYRERQNVAYTKLQSPGISIAEKHLSVTQLLKQAEVELNAVTKNLSEQNEPDVIQKCYLSRNHPDSIHELIMVNRNITIMGYKQKYLQLYIQDLMKFRNTLPKQVVNYQHSL